jgi:hypothetical protein
LPEYHDGSSDAPLGGKADGRLAKCRQYPPAPEPSTRLQLWFSSGNALSGDWWQTAGDGTVIEYQVDSTSRTLMRSTISVMPVKDFTVASNVDSMTVGDDPNDSNNLRVVLTFKFHYPHPLGTPEDSWRAPQTRTCTLILKKKP